MLKEFIKEYKSSFDISFDDGFKGKFDKFYRLVTEPKFHPSANLFERLNFLNSLNYEPPIIAVVGQFSSGKSSFLNALLGMDLLPTGVVPVTAKPTYIKYAPNLMLKALYNDGREEYHAIEELGAFVDQRMSLKDVKCLYICAPNELLKQVSFIDTPGLNSRSDADTNETKRILSRAGALIWISLIDNAARASELAELKLIPKSLKQNAICLLNQKDKLNSQEIANVLAHAKLTYDEYFDDVFAVSSKMQIAGDKNSGFDSVFSFITKLTKTKQDFIKNECEIILNSSIEQNDKFISILCELGGIFDKFGVDFETKFNQLKKDYETKFKLLFEEIKQNAKLIATEINSGLVVQNSAYYKPKKQMFGKDSFEKVEYEKVVLKSDDVLSRLIYNDEKMAKSFKKLRRELGAFEESIKNDLNASFEELKDRVLGFKAKYESLRKSNELLSDALFADIRKFSSEVYALFLNEFERTLFAKSALLGLFFEKISIKIATNYQNAIKLSVSFIEEKINKAASDYESDPLAFGLYYPRIEEINERVLTMLSYYEFENDFVGQRPFIIKFIEALQGDFLAIKDKNLAYVNALKSKYEQNKLELRKEN